MSGRRRKASVIADLAVGATAIALILIGASARAALPPDRPVLPATYDGPAGDGALAPAELDRWWRLFKDPRLDALEDEAFKTAPDARTAAARVIEARATLRSQIAQTLPTGEIKGAASDEREHNIGATQGALFPIGGRFESESVNLNPSWELDLFGRLGAARKVAKADQASTRFSIEGARASLAASVADGYFQAVGLAIQIDDARETVRIDADLERVAREKADIGAGHTVGLAGRSSGASAGRARGRGASAFRGRDRQAATSGDLSHLYPAAPAGSVTHGAAERFLQPDHQRPDPVSADHQPRVLDLGRQRDRSGLRYSPTAVRRPGRGRPDPPGGDRL
jgi:hypothetical protein